MRPIGQLPYILAALSPHRSAAIFFALSASGVYRRELRALCASLPCCVKVPFRLDFCLMQHGFFPMEKAGQRCAVPTGI
jgi:hypothetical protein